MTHIIDHQEVKKFVPPSYQEMKNSEGKTPKDIFIEEHKMFIGKRSVVSIPMHKASAMEALNQAQPPPGSNIYNPKLQKNIDMFCERGLAQ